MDTVKARRNQDWFDFAHVQTEVGVNVHSPRVEQTAWQGNRLDRNAREDQPQQRHEASQELLQEVGSERSQPIERAARVYVREVPPINPVTR